MPRPSRDGTRALGRLERAPASWATRFGVKPPRTASSRPQGGNDDWLGAGNLEWLGVGGKTLRYLALPRRPGMGGAHPNHSDAVENRLHHWRDSTLDEDALRTAKAVGRLGAHILAMRSKRVLGMFD